MPYSSKLHSVGVEKVKLIFNHVAYEKDPRFFEALSDYSWALLETVSVNGGANSLFCHFRPREISKP